MLLSYLRPGPVVSPALLSGYVLTLLTGDLTTGGSLSSTVTCLSSTGSASVASTTTEAADAAAVAGSSVGRLGAVTDLVVDGVTLLLVDGLADVLVDGVLDGAALLLVDGLADLLLDGVALLLLDCGALNGKNHHQHLSSSLGSSHYNQEIILIS